MENHYRGRPGTVLDLDRDLYARIGDHALGREVVETIDIPVRSGRAWTVPAGHIARLSAPEGPQVGDLNIWNLHNPRERFWASRTRQLHASHISIFDRLWSTLPYLRPLATVVGDSFHGFTDPDGARIHDLLGTRCDPYVNKLLSGVSFDFNCHSNLVRAVAPFGLAEFDVHDVINVFQVTGLTARGQYFLKPCPAGPEDYYELFAEVDLLMALSACPHGDLSHANWGEEESEQTIADCHPLRVEIVKPSAEVLTGWSSPSASDYTGRHGFRDAVWTRPPCTR